MEGWIYQEVVIPVTRHVGLKGRFLLPLSSLCLGFLVASKTDKSIFVSGRFDSVGGGGSSCNERIRRMGYFGFTGSV